MYDILEIYYPKTTDEVGVERITAMRSILAQRVRASGEEVDTAPNSVFGDLFLSPAAYHLAALEVAWNRFMSDLDPENIAAGVVYNCPFVEAFLKNFGIYEEDAQEAYGVLRLSFTDRTERAIDQGAVFQFNGGTFRPSLPYTGPLNLIASGGAAVTGENYKFYKAQDADNWCVDILVRGTIDRAVEAGTTATVDRTIDGLNSAVALGAFSDGVPPASLKTLSERARSTFHSRTPCTRNGVKSFLNHLYPDLLTVSPIISGDYEMTRNITNPGLLGGGQMDVCVRSSLLQEDIVTLEMDYITVNADGSKKFVGKLDLPEVPIRILSIRWGTIDAVPQIYSVSKDTASTPGVTAAYGDNEELWVAFNMPNTTGGDPAITLTADGERSYALFSVSFLHDPSLRVAQETFQHADHIPVGVDTYVRWFTPIVVEQMSVHYNRKSGVNLNLTQARKEILEAYNRHSYETPATPAAIADSMLYAGAASMGSVTFSASIQHSVADRVYLGATFAPPVDIDTYAALVSGSVPITKRTVSSPYEADNYYTWKDAAGVDNTYAASGPRNVTYLLASENLNFVEDACV